MAFTGSSLQHEVPIWPSQPSTLSWRRKRTEMNWCQGTRHGKTETEVNTDVYSWSYSSNPGFTDFKWGLSSCSWAVVAVMVSEGRWSSKAKVPSLSKVPARVGKAASLGDVQTPCIELRTTLKHPKISPILPSPDYVTLELTKAATSPSKSGLPETQ